MKRINFKLVLSSMAMALAASCSPVAASAQTVDPRVAQFACMDTLEAAGAIYSTRLNEPGELGYVLAYALYVYDPYFDDYQRLILSWWVDALWSIGAGIIAGADPDTVAAAYFNSCVESIGYDFLPLPDAYLEGRRDA